MKRNLLLVSAIAVATLASCTQTSELDSEIVSAMESAANAQREIQFSTYASSATATKGAAVNSNTDFQGDVSTHGSFAVKTLVSGCEFEFEYYDSADKAADASVIENAIKSYTATPTAEDIAVTYFDFSTVKYSSTSSSWENDNMMYWPNYSKMMHFAAYSPASLNLSEDTKTTFAVSTDDSETPVVSYEYSFDYSVTDAIESQIDLMYAMTSLYYLAPSDEYKCDENGDPVDYSYVTISVEDTNAEEAVNLHFKHALTQIAFTATKDSDLDVYVKSITICNVYNSGTFTATSLTDDDDADADTNPTVGDGVVTDDNTDYTNDKVDANKFGTWVANYNGTWALEDTADGATNTDDGTLSGSYTAATGGFSAMSNYAAAMAEFKGISPASESVNSIEVAASGTTQLTSTTEVLMLMPQKLTAWEPTTSTSLNYVGSYNPGYDSNTGIYYIDGALADGTYANPSMDDASRTLSYLAIDCEIYHAGATEYSAKIHDGYIFIPFETKDIDYNSATVDSAVAAADLSNDDEITDQWLAGYKITYCLNFGGGYVVEEGNHTTLPEPGCIPDTETYTLRTIVYTATCDAWVDVYDSQELLYL